MRLNLDPIEFSHRPLLYYVAIHVLQQGCALILRGAGFERGTVEGISYWWRDSSSSLPKSLSHRSLQDPLLFFHGIGIGLAPYLQLLLKLCARQYFSNGGKHREWCRRGVLLIEIPSIAQSMYEYTPTPSHMVRAVQAIAKLKRIFRFGAVVGHSFGTVPVVS